MNKLTVRDTWGLQAVEEIGGDLLLLPRGRLPNLSEALALEKHGIVNVENAMLSRNQLWFEGIPRQEAYNVVRRQTDMEPAWMTQMPIHVQAHLRYTYAITQEDPLGICGIMPHTGISYMVREGGLCQEIATIFDLFRLSRVRQLGFLQAPWATMKEQAYITPISEGTRWRHSLDVMMLCSVIGRNLGLSEREFNTLRVAGFTHDTGTPAGGDSVKLIDPSAFDEDLNYRRILNERIYRARWEKAMERWNIDEDVLADTILNRGLLGQILDIADKLAYVARDLETCLQVAIQPDDEDGYVGTTILKELVAEFRDVCGLWDSLETVDGKLIFTDPYRLIAFLKVRIVLFRELYYHPRARFGEYLISRVLVKRLYDEGKLTRDALLDMSDDELMRRIDQEFKGRNVLRSLSLKSQTRSFRTREEAAAFRKELGKAGVKFSLVEDHLNAIKTGTHFLVPTKEGPRPLFEAYRGDAQELWEMATMLPGVHVYYLSDDPVERDEALEDLFANLAPQ